MVNIDKCKNCIDKYTTTGCINCEHFKIKQCINDIEDFIHTNAKINNYRFVFYFNSKYYDDIKQAVDLSTIPNEHIKVTNYLENNEVCMIVDLTRFDWGNFMV